MLVTPSVGKKTEISDKIELLKTCKLREPRSIS